MRARSVRFPAPGEIELVVADVAAPGPGELRCTAEVSLVSVGTEMTCLRGQFDPRTFWEEWVQYPFAPGYSMVSRVESVGADVDALRPGDRVFSFTPHAEAFLTPVREVIAIPDGVSDEHAAWASLAVTTQWALRRAGFVFGETAAVVGLGLLGQLLVRYLRIAGARRIVAIDTDSARLALATAGGADEVVSTHVGDVPQDLRSSFDVVFDVTGHPAALAGASDVVRPLGRLVLVGDAPRPSLQHLGPRIVADGISIIGIHAGTAAEIPTPSDPWSTTAMLSVFFRYVEDGRMDLSALFTDRVAPDDAAEMYRVLERDRGAHLGVLIDWGLGR
jgi:2-desacetyl-2-hydroxyethyl bacteriochlorophyllide A dehydrogenase